MSMPSLAAAQTLAERVRASGFDQADVSLRHRTLTEIQIDAGDISLMRSTDSTEVTLRGIIDSRHASVSLNQTDDDSLSAAIVTLQQSAAASPVDTARAFAPSQGRLQRDTGPAAPQLDRMHERLTALAATVGERHPELVLEQSMLQFHRARHWRANTIGLEIDAGMGYYTAASMFSSRRGERCSSFNETSATSVGLDAPLLDWAGAGRLMASSVREIEHRPFSGRLDGPVVLTPESVFSLVDHWLAHLGDERLIAGTSRLGGAMATQVCSPFFTLRAAPDEASFAQREFVTSDGYLSQPSTLVERGVLRSFMLSDYGSRRSGLPRAANNGYNRVIDAGALPLMDIVKQIDHGLMLGRFSGGYPAANGDFSGVAKNSFLIEQGAVGQPVSEAMISGNLFDMMLRIAAVSAERVNDGISLVPWMRVDGLTISGA